MTPEAQRIAIAEACGWVRVDQPTETKNVWGSAGRPSDKQFWFAYHLPDYLNDMNAMHKAEITVLSCSSKQGYFCKAICNTVLNDARESGNPIPIQDDVGTVWAIVNSTASQRAEAFLKTIGRWTETDHQPKSEKLGWRLDSMKNGSWKVIVRCTVLKEITVFNCTEEEAAKNPFEYSTCNLELSVLDFETLSVEPIKQ